MSVTATCAACGASFRVPNEHAGKRAKCKSCGEVLSIPAAHDLDGPDEGGGAPDLPSPWRESDDEIPEGAEYARGRRERRRAGGKALQTARMVLSATRILLAISVALNLLVLALTWKEIDTPVRVVSITLIAVLAMACLTLYRFPLVWIAVVAVIHVLELGLSIAMGELSKGGVVWAIAYIGAFFAVRDALRYVESDDSSATSLKPGAKGSAGPSAARLQAEQRERARGGSGLRILGLTAGIIVLAVTAVIVFDRGPAPPPPPAPIVPPPPIDGTLAGFESAMEAGDFDAVKAMLVADYSGNWSNIERFTAAKGWRPGGVELDEPALRKNNEEAPTQCRATYAVPEYDMLADWKAVDGEWRLRKLRFKRRR